MNTQTDVDPASSLAQIEAAFRDMGIRPGVLPAAPPPEAVEEARERYERLADELERRRRDIPRISRRHHRITSAWQSALHRYGEEHPISKRWEAKWSAVRSEWDAAICTPEFTRASDEYHRLARSQQDAQIVRLLNLAYLLHGGRLHTGTNTTERDRRGGGASEVGTATEEMLAAFERDWPLGQPWAVGEVPLPSSTPVAGAAPTQRSASAGSVRPRSG